VTIFDLLFIVVFLASIVMLILASLAALRRRPARAGATLRRLGIMVGVYIGTVIVVSLLSPRRVLNVGDAQCWDDWCIAVTDLHRSAAEGAQSYEVTLRVSSRARRRAQRERGVHVYPMDDRGRCYDPETDPAAVPFDVLLQPQQAITMTRRFNIPADAHDPVLVVSHDGWFPGNLIIGDSESLFHKRTVIRIESP
jgi:hypothetical protein